jgi:hypothetical protein
MPMQQKTGRLAILLVLVVGLIVALAVPAGAATSQLSGVGVFDTTGACPPLRPALRTSPASRPW